MIVRIFKAGLNGVMVDIGHRFFCFHPIDAHSLKLQICHGAGGILGQGLVDPDRDFIAGLHVTADQMLLDDLLRQCISHFSPPMVNLFQQIFDFILILQPSI